jgi:hypothetical protein
VSRRVDWSYKGGLYPSGYSLCGYENPPPPPPPELLFAYTYEDFTGTSAADQTGLFPTLTCPGASQASGKNDWCQAKTWNGQGLQETASSTWALIDDSRDFSVSFWAQPKTGSGPPYGGDGQTLRGSSVGGQNLWMWVGGPATTTTGTWINFGGKSWQHNGISVAFHHHVITYEASTGTVTEYFDGGAGVERGTGASWGYGTGITHTCYGYYDQTRPIDELYGWSVVLTAQEASDLWNSGSGIFYPSIPRA